MSWLYGAILIGIGFLTGALVGIMVGTEDGWRAGYEAGMKLPKGGGQ